MCAAKSPAGGDSRSEQASTPPQWKSYLDILKTDLGTAAKKTIGSIPMTEMLNT